LGLRIDVELQYNYRMSAAATVMTTAYTERTLLNGFAVVISFPTVPN